MGDTRLTAAGHFFPTPTPQARPALEEFHMALFAHHTEAFFKVEIMGRDYPDGMAEHVIMFGLTAVLLVLVCYGAYAAVRDCRRWLTKPASSSSETAGA
jgi:hypothetical protein